MDLSAHLATLIPDSARVLPLRTTAELDELDAPYDVVVWRVEEAREDATTLVDRVGTALAEGGRLIVVAPLPAGASAPSRRQGSLPGRDQPRLREVVRRLSEAGFAVVKDQDLALDPPVKVLVARRDRFAVRSYREGDEAAILRLFRASFHVERRLDHWRWKYAENPWGPGLISLAEATDGDLAAHYAGYPVPIWRERNTFMALHMGDTMTDPALRDTGRGKSSLLARTVRHFFSIHRDGSHGFFYGFNTGPIQRFCRWFIGGSQGRPAPYLARELEAAPAWSPGGYRVERARAVGPAWDRFFHRVAPAYRFLVRRDARYVRWRYLERPDARYVVYVARRFGRLVGWSVFLRRDDHAGVDTVAWGDALFHPRHVRAAEPVLAAALADPNLAGARRLDAWFSGGPPAWDDQLAKLGFVSQDEPQGLGLIALGDAEPEAFERLGEMYTTMGDGDLF